MPRDSRYDILFEPVKIGPVTAKNRFYQVPHCNGMGNRYPQAIAASRGVKAEGGWSVIATEECEIHPSSDVSPYNEARLWDQSDMARLALSVESIHDHGALAAVELAHTGHHAGNRYSRLPIMGVSDVMSGSKDPVQAYAISRREISELRKMHVEAAKRARDIGFDIVYCYAGHDLAIAHHFISRRHNRRTDEYGGSLENRVRFLREILESTVEAIGQHCAVAVRFAVDELLGGDGIVAEEEGKDIVEMLAEIPDLWDVNVSDWSNDSLTARFGEEGAQEKYTAFVKQVTSKPVVGVGRFTSPDAMVSQIKRGILDMIGAARPSIADPFLPKKIEEGRLEDIRECIGCNICVSSDMVIQPLRCTQNPTTAEEYRRGWHPERIASKHKDEHVMIVGAGPAGLEAALSLGRRGYQVTLADAGSAAGGRALNESRLPGLSTWKRVIDYRLGQIEKLKNIEIHLQSALNAEQVIDFASELSVDRVALATGARWRGDGIGRTHFKPIARDARVQVLTPDDLYGDVPFARQVVIYDDDYYYIASVLAEKLCTAGSRVTIITPAPEIAAWTVNTLEQGHIEKRLLSMGVHFVTKHTLEQISAAGVVAKRINSEQLQNIDCDYVVMVTSRKPRNQLFRELDALEQQNARASFPRVTRIGDCLAPSTIAAAVYEGHRYAREYGNEINLRCVPFKRENIELTRQ
jgi:dimethylamine/trimethylamine dehydrogenase